MTLNLKPSTLNPEPLQQSSTNGSSEDARCLVVKAELRILGFRVDRGFGFLGLGFRV